MPRPRSPKKCSERRCSRTAVSLGLCSKHYQRLFRSHRVCSIDGCDKRYYSGGLCATHWRQRRRYGDPLTRPELPSNKRRCEAPRCDTATPLPPDDDGTVYCAPHRDRVARYGDPLGYGKSGRPVKYGAVPVGVRFLASRYRMMRARGETPGPAERWGLKRYDAMVRDLRRAA